MKLLTVLLYGAALGALGCGDQTTPPAATSAAPKKSGVPEPVVTAAGTHVLAFDFNEEAPCASCVAKVNQALAPLPGIKRNDAEKGKRTFTVEYDPKQVEMSTLIAALKNAGEGATVRVD
jgi:copper chaperone CopZ